MLLETLVRKLVMWPGGWLVAWLILIALSPIWVPLLVSLVLRDCWREFRSLKEPPHTSKGMENN